MSSTPLARCSQLARAFLSNCGSPLNGHPALANPTQLGGNTESELELSQVTGRSCGEKPGKPLGQSQPQREAGGRVEAQGKGLQPHLTVKFTVLLAKADPREKKTILRMEFYLNSGIDLVFHCSDLELPGWEVGGAWVLVADRPGFQLWLRCWLGIGTCSKPCPVHPSE